MTRFEDLPANVRALLLARLALELRTNRCTSLHELAKKQRIDTASAWRRICQLSKQRVCTVPEMGSQHH